MKSENLEVSKTDHGNYITDLDGDLVTISESATEHSATFFDCWRFAIAGQADNVERILDENPDFSVDSVGEEDGPTLAIWAAIEGQPEVLQKLIDRGADINKPDNDGHSALWWAVSRGHESTAMILLDNGAKVSREDIASFGELEIDPSDLLSIDIWKHFVSQITQTKEFPVSPSHHQPDAQNCFSCKKAFGFVRELGNFTLQYAIAPRVAWRIVASVPQSGHTRYNTPR